VIADAPSKLDEPFGKPPEVEGFFDRHFYSPLGFRLASAFSRTAFTPNQLSWLSVAPAAGAAAAYLVSSLASALAASALFLLSGVLDSADGQLARATNRTSELGATLDGFCDTLSFALIYLAAAAIFVRCGGSLPLIALVMVLAGVSHSVQSSLVDFERQLFIHFVTSRGRVLRDHPDMLLDEQSAARASGEGWWPQALRSMRRTYCARQRRWLASSVALLELHCRSVEPFPERHRWFAERYRRRMTPLLKGWTVLAPNSHTMGVLVCGLSPFLAPHLAAARWGLPLVFGFDLALNLALAPLIFLQRRADHALARDIETMANGSIGLARTAFTG
jgi:hypothetical protein